jgi:YegS/Rv2252/BmrU family lipid kinase
MYYFISNPTAGKKGSKKSLDLALEVFKSAGKQCTVYETTCRKDAKEIAYRLTSAGVDELIVVGGDGTLHEVLNGIVDPYKCRVGLIPAGTGNDFAEAAGLPLDPKKAAELILSGETKRTDWLEFDGVRCMNIGGMGIDVDILERCRKGKMKGKLKYLISLLRSVISYKGWEVTFMQDGEEIKQKVLVATACNGVQFGGGLKICPEAEIDDGKMDVVVVEYIKGFFNLAKAFTKLMKGTITQYPATRHFLCDEIKMEANPCPIQLDGEIYDDLRFVVKSYSGLHVYR